MRFLLALRADEQEKGARAHARIAEGGAWNKERSLCFPRVAP